MSPRVTPGSKSRDSFPRVSGDEPPILDSTEVYSGFSPRERG